MYSSGGSRGFSHNPMTWQGSKGSASQVAGTRTQVVGDFDGMLVFYVASGAEVSSAGAAPGQQAPCNSGAV
jgi:hypothetical protein